MEDRRRVRSEDARGMHGSNFTVEKYGMKNDGVIITPFLICVGVRCQFDRWELEEPYPTKREIDVLLVQGLRSETRWR